MEFVHADVLPGHVRFDSLSVVNQKAWLTLHYPSEPAVGARQGSDRVVQQQKRGRRNDAPDQRRVRPRHRILHGVGKKQQQRKIEWRHLPDLTLAAEPHPNQHDKVDDSRAQRDLQRYMRARREQDSVQLADTGTGAAFGVLKYPVALFLSAVQTTSSNSKCSRPE